jgi:hypothetical protein
VTLGELADGTVFRDGEGTFFVAAPWREYRSLPGRREQRRGCLRLGASQADVQTPLSADAPVTPVDVPALARERDELAAMLRDVAGDGGFRLGRDSMLALVLGLAEATHRKAVTDGGLPRTASTLADLADRLRALGTPRDFPPDQMAAENERLRAALRRVVGAGDDYTAAGHGQYPGPLLDAVDAARAALGDDPP